VELARLLSTSSEGIVGHNLDLLRDRFNYGSRTVANHEQGRENLVFFICFSKEQFLPKASSGGKFSQVKF